MAIDCDMPGFFVFAGENWGFQYELLKAFSRSNDIEFVPAPGLSMPTIGEKLSRGEVDIVVTKASNATDMPFEGNAVELYSTQYVVLCTSRNAATWHIDSEEQLLERLERARIYACDGFKGSDSYNMLLDSLPEAQLYVSSLDRFELMRSLADGNADFLICEQSEAQLGCSLMKNLTQVYQFEDQIPMVMFFPSNHTHLYQSFHQWFESFRRSSDYEALCSFYFDKGLRRQVVNINRHNRVVGGISVWDPLIRQVGEREGQDWRLLSAIAYHESRFNADIVSERGAQGMMQIMPAVARQFKVNEENIADPEVNIVLATKVLNLIGKCLMLPDSVDTENRLKLTLASYNCGVGVVTNARKLAASMGCDPNDWQDVKEIICAMNTPDMQTDTIRYNIFRGSRQTIAYVDNVMERYHAYCQAVD